MTRSYLEILATSPNDTQKIYRAYDQRKKNTLNFLEAEVSEALNLATALQQPEGTPCREMAEKILEDYCKELIPLKKDI